MYLFEIHNLYKYNFSDMSQTQWSGKSDNGGEKYREMSYTISLTHPMGPKHSSTNETQVC